MAWKAWAAGAVLGLGWCGAVVALPPAVEAQFQGSTLLLEFREPINHWDNALQVDTVRTTPRLPTICHWGSDTRLSCALGTAPAPATRYRIEVAEGLRTQAGALLGAQVLSLETERPDIRATIARWERGVPAIELVAQQPVEATALGAVLRLRLNGKPVAPILSVLPPAWSGDKRTRFALALPTVEQHDALLELAIRPGLRSRAGPLLGSQDKTLLRARLNPPFQLLGVACAGVGESVAVPVRADAVVASCAADRPVNLVFSRPVDGAGRAEVERNAGLATTTGREVWSAMPSPFADAGVAEAPVQWMRIDAPGPNAAIDLQLGEATRSEDGARLPPVAVHIRTGEAQPQLRGRKRALVADGARLPPLLQAVNVGETPIRLEGLGLRALDAQVLARSPRHGSQPQAVRSAEAERILGEGGWIRWTPQQDATGYQWRRSVEFAAPAFDLVAMTGRREVLAWANAWDRDAPVADALIELLWREPGVAEPRVIATGRTDADGTVLLKLPDDLVLTEPTDDESSAVPGVASAQWMLRAAQVGGRGMQRAVLPLDGVEPYADALGAAMPRKVWGVSDRPLYRAGDTVHYRLWQRVLDGVRLRAPRGAAAMTLRLHNQDEDKLIREWSATPAADGSFAGELVLPVHLTDATYCIGVEAGYEVDGTCFFVGTYRAQDLWMEARSRGGVLRDGERFTATVRAGYFSGGPAAGADITSAEVALGPERLEVAYPQFADFAFVDVDDEDTSYVELAGIDAYDALDGNGEARIDVPVVFAGTDEEVGRRPAFGVLIISAEASPEDREGTVAYEHATRYARHDRYVGLRTHPDWFGSIDPVSLEAVVITAQGREVADARVIVDIDYLEGYDVTQPGRRLASCKLRVRIRMTCAFDRERTGLYRLTAHSDGAAPAVLRRYVWRRGGGTTVDVTEPELTVLAQAQPDRPARLLLKQPFARARILLVVSHGGNILGHRVEAIEGSVRELLQTRAPEWPGLIQVRALVRETGVSRTEAGWRMPARTASLEAWLESVATDTPGSPVVLRFATTSARPGTTAHISLHNDSSHPRTVVLSVMDDALRAQAQRWLPYSDPQGPLAFRESLLQRGRGYVRWFDFDEYTGESWRWLLPWADAAAAAKALRQPAQPVAAVPPAQLADHYAESTALDRIEVTGSRIRRADLESNETGPPDPGLRLQRQNPTVRPDEESASVRSHFADTALWLPDLPLAPGESRTIEVTLPDNLTRWRAVAWSTDDDGDVAMTDAALEVGLPVEVRLQAPVRIYPGDATRVATSVRHVADATATAHAGLVVRATPGDALAPVDDTQSLTLAPREQGSVATVLQPQAPGLLELVASARTAAGVDAVAGRIEVASPVVTTRRRQAGWIGADKLHLPLPAMPAHAHDPSLRVSLLRGGAGLTSEWTRELRDYPHRCWEQILSRAVGAALALERRDPEWPDAGAAVAEALDNAAVFQGNGGGFVYFPAGDGYEPDGYVPLTAYTLRAFALLRALGHRVPAHVESAAREFLVNVDAPSEVEAGEPINEMEFADFAYAHVELMPENVATLDALWTHWKHLPLPVQVASAQALARAKHPAAARAVRSLLGTAPRRGAARTLRLSRRYDAWMSSSMREQCALIALLGERPQLAAARVRQELFMGLNDLYAGGVPAVDTQTAAQCLMAVREPAGVATVPVQASFTIARRTRELVVPLDEVRAEWQAGNPGGTALEVAGGDAEAPPASYVAELTWQEDASLAQPSAVGLSLDRRHEVLRAGAWKPVQGEVLREGDWIRITLVVRTSAARAFVALTDDVPGGLQPTDLSLSGVATADLKRIADNGSSYFATRRLDPRKPKFYAESLPAGQHAVHYFARVGNAGDYLAAPAVAELMYGEATHARTAATRLRVDPAP